MNAAKEWYRFCLLALIIWSLITFFILLCMPAFYGRYSSQSIFGRHLRLPTRLVWLLMESISSAGFAIIYLKGEHSSHLTPFILHLLWQTHYIQRAFIYPFLMRVKDNDQTSIIIPITAILFNLFNSFVNAANLSWKQIGSDYRSDWLTDPRFIIGTSLFIVGYYVNRKADAILFSLRDSPTDKCKYKIPRGWLYEYVTCPNYLGEHLIWLGWTIATWSTPGLVFLMATAGNLVPRAISHHHWYCEKFPNYPRERKILIPYIF